MKLKELIERLQNVDPEAEIWVRTHNEANTVTYGVMDQVFEFNYENLWPDLQNTFSDIDDLLIDGKQEKGQNNLSWHLFWPLKTSFFMASSMPFIIVCFR